MLEKMEIRTKYFKGTKYYSFTDIMKHNRTNLTQESGYIPSNHVIKGGRGRSSCTYVDKVGLSVWYNHKRYIKCSKVESYLINIVGLKKKDVYTEDLFVSILETFLGQIDCISTKKQFAISTYQVDFCINNKIVIEFDEYSHKHTQDEDKARQLDIENLGYSVFRVDSNLPIGESIHKVVKFMKDTLGISI